MHTKRRSNLVSQEDWWAIWLGAMLLAVVAAGLVTAVPAVGRWSATPLDALAEGRWLALAALGLGLMGALSLAVAVMIGGARRFARGFGGVFLLAIVAYGIAQHDVMRAAGVGYAFWALSIGLCIANVVGTPAWLKPALRGELYIKTGLVLLGAEILFGSIVELGIPGLFVAWLVTPIVLLSMYQVGTRWLRIPSRGLVIVIAAATSVCGVSAAIATAAAVRLKKEELTLAVGMSLVFTVVMMVLMPLGIRAVGMDPIVGGAWIGGTVDATGAVVAAGAMLGPQAEQVAAVVKLIQNTMIGVIAFLVAAYWVARVDVGQKTSKPNVSEIWNRFPKFIIGFVAASIVFSFVLVPLVGMPRVQGILDLTSDLRGWLFCIAFLSIGLESSFRELGSHVSGGRPIQLYVAGQTFNLVLTLGAAYLAFGGILFDRIPETQTRADQPASSFVIQNNLDVGRDATPLFYTEVDGWGAWLAESAGTDE